MRALIVIPMQYIYLFMRIWRCVSLQLGIYLQELHSCVARAHATLHSCAIYPNDCYSTLKISQFEMQLTLIMPWHLIYSAPRNEIVFVFNWAVAAMHFVFFFWMNICIVLDLILHNAFSDIHIHNTRAHCESCYVCKCNDGNGKLIFVVALYFIQNRTIIIFFHYILGCFECERKSANEPVGEFKILKWKKYDWVGRCSRPIRNNEAFYLRSAHSNVCNSIWRYTWWFFQSSFLCARSHAPGLRIRMQCACTAHIWLPPGTPIRYYDIRWNMAMCGKI